MSKISIQDRYGGSLVMPLCQQSVFEQTMTEFIAGDDGADDLFSARLINDRLYEHTFAARVKYGLRASRGGDARYVKALAQLDGEIERLRRCGLLLTDIQGKIAKEEMF